MKLWQVFCLNSMNLESVIRQRLSIILQNREEQREAASLFNTTIQVETNADREKAFKETLGKILTYSLEQRTANLDPTDMKGLQQIIADRKKMTQIQKIRVDFGEQ